MERTSPPVTVAIALADGGLRNLLREHLETNGMRVVSVRKVAREREADVLITDSGAGTGVLLTVRLASSDVDSPYRTNGTLFYPRSRLDRLPDVLTRALSGSAAHG